MEIANFLLSYKAKSPRRSCKRETYNISLGRTPLVESINKHNSCGSEKKMAAFLSWSNQSPFNTQHYCNFMHYYVQIEFKHAFYLMYKKVYTTKEEYIFHLYHKLFLNPIWELSLYLGKWPLSLITQSSRNTVECEV